MNMGFLFYLFYIFFTLFTVVVLITKQEFVRNHSFVILFSFIFVLVASQFQRYLFPLFLGDYNLNELLPCHICRMSAILSPIYLCTKWDKIKHIVFYWSALGVFGVLLPNGKLTLRGYAISFIYDHFFLTLVPIYMIVYLGYKPVLKNIIKPFILVVTIMVPFIVINPILGTNFFYIREKIIISDIWPNASSIVFVLCFALGILLAFIVFCRLGKILYNKQYHHNRDTLEIYA